MGELPLIDEHSIRVDASAEEVWAALGDVLAGLSSGGARALGRLLGARPRAARGSPLELGSSLTGFRVARVAPGRELELAGEHRFSRYSLTFRVEALATDRSRLRAETRAEFPGLRGRAYRALVIGTRGHVVAVRRLLGAATRRAERG